MEQRLVELGHLLIHTRQLDMMMTNDAIMAEHKRRIIGELAQVRGAAD